MSGCYKCGLPDGTDDRLCETCFTRRFECGRLSLDPFAATPATGFEISPRLQRWLLSSGAFLYIVVLSLGMAVQDGRVEARSANPSKEFLRLDGNQYPVHHSNEFSGISGPQGLLWDR